VGLGPSPSSRRDAAGNRLLKLRDALTFTPEAEERFRQVRPQWRRRELVKVATVIVAALGVVATSLAAHAQERRPDADVPERAAPAKKKNKKDGVAIGFQLESAAASVHVSRGNSRGATKTTPATEDLAALRVRGLGAGVLSLGTSFSAPFTRTANQPRNAMDVIPFVNYRAPLSPLEMTGGFVLKIFPDAEIVDGQYEILTRVAYPNKWITPAIEILPEVLRRRGAYAAVSLEHDFVYGPVSIRPRVLLGSQGFDLEDEPFHVNELTAIALARVMLGSGFYAMARPGFSLMLAPARYVDDPTWRGRSLAYVAVGMGVER